MALIPPDFPEAAVIDFAVPCILDYIAQLTAPVKAQLCAAINDLLTRITTEIEGVQARITAMTNAITSLTGQLDVLGVLSGNYAGTLGSISGFLGENQCDALAAFQVIIAYGESLVTSSIGNIDIPSMNDLLSALESYLGSLQSHQTNITSFLALLEC